MRKRIFDVAVTDRHGLRANRGVAGAVKARVQLQHDTAVQLAHSVEARRAFEAQFVSSVAAELGVAAERLRVRQTSGT